MPVSKGFQPGRSVPIGSRRMNLPLPRSCRSVAGAGYRISPSWPNHGPRNPTSPIALPIEPPAAAASRKDLPPCTAAAIAARSTPAERSIAVRSAPATVCGFGRPEAALDDASKGRASRKKSVSSGSIRRNSVFVTSALSSSGNESGALA